MVSLTDVQSSNSRLASALPPGLVAIFVGGTRGIGETSLKEFAKHARKPRVYFIGRSQKDGDRVAAECKELNSEGEYVFLKADTSLICNVDDVCRDIKSREKAVNLLFLTTGTLVFDTSMSATLHSKIVPTYGKRALSDYSTHAETSEDLRYAIALAYYSRTRFIINLLPLLQQATALRRVVTVFAGGKEGPLDTSDFQGWNISALSGRGHVASLVTLSLEALAKKAPEVTFIHNFPGAVKTDIAKDAKGVVMSVLKVAFMVIGPLIYIPNQECGERHVFLATSAKYPAGAGKDASGVPLAGELVVARGTNGEIGTGVYTVGSDGESAGPKVMELLAKSRKEGVVEKIWKHTEEEFKRITGTDTA